MLKGAVLLLLLFNTSFAQENAIYKRLAEIEKGNSFQASIIELKKIIAAPGLSAEEIIAAKTTLIHQYQELKQWDTCLQYCYAQIVEAQHQKNSLAEATFYKLTGNTYYHVPDKAKAVEYWNKSIAISEPNHYNTLLEQCYHNIGANYLEKGEELALAESYFRKSLNIGLVNHSASAPENIQHYRLLATTYERSNQLDKAEKLYLDIIEKNKAAKDTAFLAESMMFYSDVLIKKKELQKAIETSAEALALSRKIQRLDVTNTALELHAKNLFLAGKYREAFQFEEELNVQLRGRFASDLNERIGDGEAKFKNAEIKHEKEVALLKAEKDKQFYLISFIGLTCIAGFIFYYLYQRRTAKQRTILQQARIQSLLDGEEKERTRIAKDLHDGIVQDLTAIKLRLNAAINKEGFIDSNTIVNAMDSIDKASREVRNISYQMMPVTLTQLGFIPAIEDLLKRVLTPGNIKYEFEQIGIHERLPEKIEVCIFRITQELLNNVLKHSEADFVSLLITLKTGMLTMIFEDNGKGFDEKTIEKGIGFNSIKSRLALLNAEIKYENQEETGTVAIIKIPLIFEGHK